MSFWQANCFEMVFEVWGQTFKMIILTCILLYSRVFLHLLHNAFESNKIRLKKKKTVSTHFQFTQFTFCEPLFITGQQIFEGKIFFFLFSLSICVWTSCFCIYEELYRQKNLYAQYIQVRNPGSTVFRLLSKCKTEKKNTTPKNQYVTFIFSLYVYWFFLHFTESVYIIISNNQSLLCFHYKYWKWFRMTQKMFLLICSKEKKPHFISGTLLQPQNHCMLLLNRTSYPSLSLSSWTAFCCFFKHTYYFSLYISNTFHIWILAWLPEFHWRHSILATSHLQWPAIFLLQEGSL